jgi:hypothetical protein
MRSPDHPSPIVAVEALLKIQAFGQRGPSMTTTRVAVNGYGVIGRRMAGRSDPCRTLAPVGVAIYRQAQFARIGLRREEPVQCDLPAYAGGLSLLNAKAGP